MLTFVYNCLLQSLPFPMHKLSSPQASTLPPPDTPRAHSFPLPAPQLLHPPPALQRLYPLPSPHLPPCDVVGRCPPHNGEGVHDTQGQEDVKQLCVHSSVEEVYRHRARTRQAADGIIQWREQCASCSSTRVRFRWRHTAGHEKLCGTARFVS